MCVACERDRKTRGGRGGEYVCVCDVIPISECIWQVGESFAASKARQVQ
jgi:hypothetical protein